MDAVEINAGSWYLRALRADDRISDIPSLDDLDVPDPIGYVEVVSRGWHDDSLFVWAVCIPTTGELVAVVGVVPDSADGARLVGSARDGYTDALESAVAPVTRFADGALGFRTSPLVEGVPGR